MKQILVYADSLSWGIIPLTRQRLAFENRWPGVLEILLNARGQSVRVIENCLNGRRTVFDDPFKAGRNGMVGLAQTIEMHSPLSLVILMLGTNDFQSMHTMTPWQSAQGIRTLVQSVRQAPIEPGMPIPPVLVIAPPVIQSPLANMQDKFRDAQKKSVGLSTAYAEVCQELGCAFFDSAKYVKSSGLDGVHLDASEHHALGRELTPVVLDMLDERLPPK